MKAYFWMPDEDAESGVVVIAENVKEAKTLGASYWASAYGHDDHEWFIRQRCRLCKEGQDKVSDLPKGAMKDYKEALKRGFCSWIEDECDKCKTETQLYQVVNGKCICSDCDEKE